MQRQRQDVVVSFCQSFFWFAAWVCSFCKKQVDNNRRINKDDDDDEDSVDAALPTSSSLFRRLAAEAGTRVAFVFFEEAAAARIKKRARIEDNEDDADSCDKASASHENKDKHDDEDHDSCPRATPSKKKRAAPAAAVSAFTKKRAGIEDDDDDDDHGADPGDNDNDYCLGASPRQKKRAPLAVGGDGCVSVEKTRKKTAKQTGARGPLFARGAEAARRDKFSCRHSECRAGASLLSLGRRRPAAVCLEEPDVCDLRSSPSQRSVETSQISEADVASSAAVSSAAKKKAAASNKQWVVVGHAPTKHTSKASAVVKSKEGPRENSFGRFRQQTIPSKFSRRRCRVFSCSSWPTPGR